MNGATSNSGYTVFEALIFIVISSFIFVSAWGLFSGRQDQTQYQQAIRELDGHIQAMLNDVSTGFFPRQDDYSCTAGSNPDRVNLASGVSGQGANQDCMFLGKFMEIDDSTGEWRMTVTTIAGLRPELGSNWDNVVAEAKPTPVNDPGGVSLNEARAFAWGLSLVDITDQDGVSINGFGALSDTGSASSSGDIRSGNRNISLYKLTSSIAQGAGVFTPEPVSSDDAVYLCLESPNGSQKGVIIIGKDGRQLSTSIDQDATGKYNLQCGTSF